MAIITKYYCDVCDQEVQSERLNKINAIMKGKKIRLNEVEIDVCDKCIGRLGFENRHYDTFWTEMNRDKLRRNLQEGLRLKINYKEDDVD